jgi:predicted lipid-binding transport protein (Tim44 family)
MRHIRFSTLRGSRSSNPFVQLFGLVIGIILFIGAVLLGGVIIAALIGFLLVAGLILYIRIWWLTRKAVRQQQQQQQGQASFVEAEYQVIEPSSTDDQQR